MGHGVFIHRSDSIYDDSPAERYQFPSQYLGRVQSCIGDWIIYYEPRKVADTRGYFAMAKVERIVPDTSKPDMYLALVESGSYLDFINPVPFTDQNGTVNERGALNNEGRISGRAQSAVRPLSTDDFNHIVAQGFNEIEPILPRVADQHAPAGFQEVQAPFEFERIRDRAIVSVSRLVRDRIFRRVILRAYSEKCAISGLRLLNGSGRAEVAAAHIRPVEANGPDIVNNGLALSGTVHWMFDRGLISLADDLRVMISRQANDPDSIRALINKSGYAFPPRREIERPHPHFLQWHREHCFKQ
jgi:putative restriction endonuclease